MMDRRKFIEMTCAIGGLTVIASTLNSCKQATTPTPNTSSANFSLDLTLPANAPLKSIGGVVYQNNIAIIRTGTSSYVALSQICTHQGCTLSYNVGPNQMYCSCHGGTFDINGNVVAGPPPSPIT